MDSDLNSGSILVRIEAAETYQAVITAFIEAAKLVQLSQGERKQWSREEREFAAFRAAEKLHAHLGRAQTLVEKNAPMFRDAHERLRVSPSAIYEAIRSTRASAHEAAVDYALKIHKKVWPVMPREDALKSWGAAAIGVFWKKARKNLIFEYDDVETVHAMLIGEVKAAKGSREDNLTEWEPRSVDDLFGVEAAAASPTSATLGNAAGADSKAPTLKVALEKRTLTRGNVEVRVEPKPLNLIEHMLSRPDGIAGVRELEQIVWGEVSEGDTRLSSAIKKANQALQAVAAGISISRSGDRVIMS